MADETQVPQGKESQPASKSGDGTSSLIAIVAVVALIVALLAGGVAGWSYLQQQSLSALPDRVGADEGRLKRVEQRLEALTDSLELQQREVAGLQRDLQAQLDATAELPQQVAALREQVLALPGVNARGRAQWLQAEAIYYLRLANAQASLAGNAEVAASALALADEKLRDSGDPSVEPVRARIAGELAELQAMPEVDRAGIVFRLQSLASRVDDWPFRQTMPDSFDTSTTPPDYELGPWDRFIATLKSVFSSIVSVKQTEVPENFQLSAAEQSLVRESVKSELQVARLAFIGGNGGLFETSLERVAAQLGTYFDNDAAAVRAATESVAGLRATEMPGELPDISGSLTLLLSASQSAAPPAAQAVAKPAVTTPPVAAGPQAAPADDNDSVAAEAATGAQ